MLSKMYEATIICFKHTKYKIELHSQNIMTLYLHTIKELTKNNIGVLMDLYNKNKKLKNNIYFLLKRGFL